MHSLRPEFLDALGFGADQLKSIRKIGDARGQQALWFHQVPELLRELRQHAVIESTESSSRIEGVTVTPERLTPLVLKRTDPRNRSEQELAGYRDALGLIHESGRDMRMTGNVLRQLHQTLFRYMADPGGQWKQAPNDIIERHADGRQRLRFAPTAPHLVPTQIDQLAQLHSHARNEQREPLVLIPLVVLDFLCIHPFRDGNGRVARLLTLMLLYQSDYEVGRYVSLERVIEQSKQTYYETLEASSQGWHEGQHDVMPWLNYFWGVLIRAYGEFSERMASARPGAHGGKGQQVRHAVLSQNGPFTLTAIEQTCTGVSRDMVRHVLRQMRSEGLVEVTGRGRGAQWNLVNQPSDPAND